MSTLHVKLAPSILSADFARLGEQVEALEQIVCDLDQVLVMTVNPGFGHQQFIHTTLPKIGRARELIERLKPACDLEVDGGIDATTAPLAVRAGANVLVAGSAVFGDRDGVASAMQRLRSALNQRGDGTGLPRQRTVERKQSCRSE